jgi:hypothetical protein
MRLKSISQIVLVIYVLGRSDHGEGTFLTYNARAREIKCMKLIEQLDAKHCLLHVGGGAIFKFLLKKLLTKL